VGWLWVQLGETGRIFNGNSASESEKQKLQKVAIGHPFIATKDVGYGRDPIGYENGLRVSFDDENYKVAKANSVLICLEGGSAGKKIGITDRDICFGNKLFANECWSGIEPRYIFYVYQSTCFYRSFSERLTGIIGGVARSEFVRIPVPLPPLAEQKRIVAKVDELMALCDQLEATREERERRRDRLAAASLSRIQKPAEDEDTFCEHARFHLANLSKFTNRPDQIPVLRKTILDLAVRGKLVPQNPNDEPALELLKRIKVEKARSAQEGKDMKGKKAVETLSTEGPFDLPAGWSWARLSSICRRIHYGYTASANQAVKEVRLLRITDIQNDSVNWDSVPGCNITSRELENFKLERGDLVIARTGGTIGKTFLVADVPVAAVFASYLIRVQGSTELLDRYLKLFTQSSVYWEQLQDGTRGGAQPNVNGQTLGRMTVPVPPFAEQHRIVAMVDDLMALCDRLEAKLTSTQTESHRLLEALLHQALEPALEEVSA
jgi:type I restriction enzyme S subunit